MFNDPQMLGPREEMVPRATTLVARDFGREGAGPVVVEAVPRRGLRREEAARFVGVSPTKFDEMVGDGRMPKPRRIDGCVVWDLKRLDLAWDALGGDEEPAADTSWDDFR